MIKNYLIFIIITMLVLWVTSEVVSRFDVVLILVLIIMLVLGFNIIKEVYSYLKVQNGIFVTGRMISFRKLTSDEKSNANYEVEVEFTNPDTNEYKVKKFYLFLYKKPEINRLYKIWINKRNSNDFILVNKFNWNWVLLLIIGSVIWLCLLTYLIFTYK